ncbi:MAG: hypothetical protein AVDCRST_MAG64-3520, partial [uncultured Phycisphaerae bacterium]
GGRGTSRRPGRLVAKASSTRNGVVPRPPRRTLRIHRYSSRL